MALANVPAVTDASFAREVEQHDGIVLVDFGAEWCPPCHAIAPVVEGLARDHAGHVKVLALDVDANPQVSTRFQVRGLPTVLFFRGGQLVDRVVGAVPRSTLDERLRQHLTSHA